MSIFVFVSFSAVNGISFSSAFSFTAENEKMLLLSASSIHHKKVLVLILKKVLITSLVRTISTRYRPRNISKRRDFCGKLVRNCRAIRLESTVSTSEAKFFSCDVENPH